MTTRLASTARTAAPSIPPSAALAAGVVVGTAAGLAAGAGSSAICVGVVLGALMVAAGVPDLRERRIPNVVVLAGSLAALAITVAVAVGGNRPVIASVIAGAVIAGGLMLALHLARPAGLGFGDVKLAAVLGATLGIVHWSAAAVMLGLASLTGTAGALAVRAWRRSIPFGACMGVAAVVTLAVARWLHERAGLW